MRSHGIAGTCLWAAVAALATALAFAAAQPAFAEDWPMWGRDAARSGMTPMELPETLHLHWTREMPAPRRAWRPQMDDRDKLEFDLSYSPVVMGGRMFVASMTADSLTAYDVDAGRELWRYYADGPMRVAPAAWEGKVYAVSDDGHLHCVDAASGGLLWKFDARPAGHRVLGNERVISMWAARGGPVVKDGVLYFASGVWPFLGTFLFALDAETGDVLWAKSGHSTEWQAQPHRTAYSFAGIAPQGYLAASGNRLVVSGGRSVPGLFDRRTGDLIHANFRAKPQGGYRVRIDGEHFYNHGARYRLADGGGAGRGELVNEALQERVEAVRDQLDADVFESLAASGRLFVVSQKGTIYCFGPEEREATVHPHNPRTPRPRTDAAGRRAAEILARSGHSQGYALFLGAGDGDLLEQVAIRCEMHVVAIEPDEEKVAALRRRFDDAGLYGPRIAIIRGDPLEAHYPKHISSLIVMEDASALGRMPDAAFLQTVYDWLRPYNGKALLGTSPATQAAFAAALAGFEPAAGSTRIEGGAVVLAREGALPGSGQWTHQHGDSAQTVMSRDDLVRAPFGPIWFGGPTNDNLLPRHASGPRPQAAGGRLVVLGVETVSARCVFTGREIWVREFPGIGHPFTNLDFEEQWRAGRTVHMANQPRTGATYIGSPYVTQPDAVYVRYRGRVFWLDPDTGETVAEWPLPARGERGDAPDWGHISVHGDYVVATTDPHFFGAGALGRHGVDAWDGSSSGRLVVLNRHTGEVAWTRDAEVGFRHNAIASANGRLFVNDLLTDHALEMAMRRGMEVADTPRMMALDIRTGEPLWTAEGEVFGTFISCSEEHGILVEGGIRMGPLAALPDEPGALMVARRASDGEVLWRREGRYEGPVILHGDTIVPGRPPGRRGIAHAVCLLTGLDKTRTNPVTGEETEWNYWKSYGCGMANASQHLLLFRSGAAGFADLQRGGGTGTLGGFRAGCTANLIAADGVLNAPDYTRTCSCSYQNQTSLGLIHMPEMDLWAVQPREQRAGGPVARLGVNLGAPGDRLADDGTLWTPFPQTGAPSGELAARLNTVDFADAPVRVVAASTSTGNRGGYVHSADSTLDGSPFTVWSQRGNRAKEFNEWLQYELNEPTTLDRVEIAWRGPEATQLRILTSLDGQDWATVHEEESRGTAGELGAYAFEPTEARFVRLAFDSHGEVNLDGRGRQRALYLYVTQVRIGDLPYPDAYAYFMPKDFFRKHSLTVDGANGLNWVAASGVRGCRYLEIRDLNGGGRPYAVTLHFAEPDGLQPGQRVFDIALQGQPAAAGFDVARAAGGPGRAVTMAFEDIAVDGHLRIELKPTPGSEHPPVLSGVEIVRKGQREGGNEPPL